MDSTATDQWGPCKTCEWWQIEPTAAEENLTVGVCIEKQLQPLLLRVSGQSGCNHHHEGEPQREEGSSENPPSPSVVGS
ncbi:hypothetical protein Mal64_26000 [Pseudobythopirellula maris]|uniref:Uncharacterized protein n=1 Tax=Pseudobythopirellula maris TaxID=2527991 RepID=A0A5C5ZPT4_9BACT|nr:hypothetical protein [Pseudobythopirellula maris]TWT89108.1 hypothetical protein Mal64_26000 [Pseudobythopirellula maris]